MSTRSYRTGGGLVAVPGRPALNDRPHAEKRNPDIRDSPGAIEQNTVQGRTTVLVKDNITEAVSPERRVYAAAGAQPDPAIKSGGRISKQNNHLGKTLKQQRLMAGLTLQQLSGRSGISASYLARIERGERYPSASILRKIASPLNIGEVELLVFAGFLSPQSVSGGEVQASQRLDPYVASVLSQECPEVQRAVVSVVSLLTSVTKGLVQ